MNLKNAAVFTVGKNYRIQFWGMAKIRTINKMKNADFGEKVDNCKYEEKQIIAMSINMTKEQSCHEKKPKN